MTRGFSEYMFVILKFMLLFTIPSVLAVSTVAIDGFNNENKESELCSRSYLNANLLRPK
jgi:hypothetical protein